MVRFLPHAITLLVFIVTGSVSGAPDGAYILRVEAPFLATSPAWLPLRVSVQVKDGKPAVGIATAQQLNLTWHDVDVSGLTLADNRFTGELNIRFRRDDIQQTQAENAMANPKPNWRYSDPFTGFTGQAITIDCPVGTLAGAASGEARWDRDGLGGPRAPAGKAAMRAWPEKPVDASQPQHVEMYVLRWTDTAKGLALDAMTGSASILLRGVLAGGKTAELIALQSPERYQMQYADLVWRVTGGTLEMANGQFKGEAVLTPSEELRKKLSTNFHPLPPQPLRVSLQGRSYGRTLAGTAKITLADKTVESMVLGQVRAFAYVRHADRTPRTWDYTAQADPALVQASRREAVLPIRPGEPGKRLFWSDAVRFGGYDRFLEGGRTVVQFDGGPKRELLVMPEEEYRAKLKEQTFGSIAAPSFDLKTVTGAVKYRLVVQHTQRMHDPVAAFEHTFEAAAPWSSLGPIWDRIPPQQYKHPYTLTVTGLDAQGAPVGEPQTVQFIKRASFDGPYHKQSRSYRDAALLSARWMRDNPCNHFARLGVGAVAGHAGGDGQLWYPTFSGMYAGLALAQQAPDPAERSDGLEIAVVTGDIWLRSMMLNYLPDTYKGWTFDQWVYGTAWLDLYRLTGDRRFHDAVLEHARRLVARQMANGNWPEVEASNGHASVDPKTGRPFIQSLQGPTMQQWDPSSTLYYLGRIRSELKTDEFKPAEDKAYQWVMDHSVARMDWRKQGPHASEDHKMPWTVLPDCALHFFNYLALDLPGRTPDWELMADLLRWSEDRVVDWRRIRHGTDVYPRIGYIKNRDLQARLACAFAVLAAHTKNPLHQAKADALASAILVAQFPTTGQIPHVPRIDTALSPLPGYAGPGSGDGGNRGEYATMALLRLSDLAEARP